MNNEHKILHNDGICEKFIEILSSDASKKVKTYEVLKLKTIPDQVDFILELLESYNLSPVYVGDSKNNKKSLELRALGNKAFTQKNDGEALELYTYSIAFAEDKSADLGIAYANRSAVLFSLKLFEDCLKDIERAAENNYPNALRQKISDRKEKALYLKSTQNKTLYHQAIPKIDSGKKNPFIESASDSIEIKSDSELGRYVVATKDIEIGEIIAVETPVFSVLNDFRWCHCYHCLNLCYNLIPCDFCTKALFCCMKCKDESAYYHQYECQILATIESFGYNSCRLLPLRIAICMKDANELIGTQEPNSHYKSGRYKEIHDLVTNLDQRSISDILERIICTALFYKTLKEHTNIFEGQLDEMNFVSLVFHHLQIMACNYHNIDELCLQSNGIYESVQIGSGAYSFLSLFNHSCVPNICRTSYGTVLCVSAIETIKKGEQLCDNYGFHFAIHPKSVRQKSLKKQYYFECGCRACAHDWDLVRNLKHLNLPNPFAELHEYFARANVEVAREKRPSVIKALKKLEKNIPNYEFCEMQEILKQCDAILGNVRRSFLTS